MPPQILQTQRRHLHCTDMQNLGTVSESLSAIPQAVERTKWSQPRVWYLRGFLHLVPNVDLTKLFKKAQHGQFQLLVTRLSQARICQVHQLEHPRGGKAMVLSTVGYPITLEKSSLYGNHYISVQSPLLPILSLERHSLQALSSVEATKFSISAQQEPQPRTEYE